MGVNSVDLKQNDKTILYFTLISKQICTLLTDHLTIEFRVTSDKTQLKFELELFGDTSVLPTSPSYSGAYCYQLLTSQFYREDMEAVDSEAQHMRRVRAIVVEQKLLCVVL